MKKLAILDGKSIFYRGYYAMPGLSTKDGIPTGGVYGFASIAIEIIKKLEPDYIAVAWDIKGTSTSKRTEIYKDYKAGRTKPPDDFYAQLPILRDVLDAFNWPLYEIDHYEADDIIGTFAAQAKSKNVRACIVSGDYDMLQLIDDNTDVYITEKGGTGLRNYDSEAFKDKYGVDVSQFVDYKAIVGDKSDNIPGVMGVGGVGAKKLLNQYETLDNIYKNIDEIKGSQQKKLIQDKDNAFMSRKLAKIICDAPIDIDWDDADINNTDLKKIASALNKYEFTSLSKRLPGHMHEVGYSETNGLYVEKKSNNLSLIEWSNKINADKAIVCYVYEGTLYLSPNRREVMSKKIQDIDDALWSTLSLLQVVGYDIKNMLHILAEHNIYTDIDNVHDLRQGAFLLDPLSRDRSLSNLYGTGEINEDDPRQVVAALWNVYDAQTESFSARDKLKYIAYKLDFPMTRLLFDMESRGVQIDKDFLGEMSIELDKAYKKIEKDIFNIVGHEFNIASPQQLSDVLFNELKLPTVGIKRGKTGFSTGQKELNKLRGSSPIIEYIESSREIAKLKNTYVDTLPLLADVNSRLHTTFSQDTTSTGRLSSSNPNLQNIPIRSNIGKKIRKGFIAKTGKTLVSADYSQFELRLAAIMSDDTELISDFNNDIDIHTKTASDVYGIEFDKVTKDQRRAAKVINFGVLYGMSPHGLSEATGMSQNEAKDFIDNYFLLRAPIRKFIDKTIKQAEQDGFVETYYGRHRPTPDTKSSNFMVREAAKRAAANMPIQGTEADLMKRAMLEVEQRLGDKGEQILQIHDSILVECDSDQSEDVSSILKSVMENIAPELNIKLKVDVSSGRSWSEL